MTNKHYEYPSFENSKSAIVNKIFKNLPSPTEEWLILEKVHGSNLSFLGNAQSIKVCSRTQILGPPSDIDSSGGFKKWQPYFETWAPNMQKAISHVIENKNIYCRGTNEDIKQVALYGELCGGKYDHADVPPINNLKPVQPGNLQYHPNYIFVGFDIQVIFESGKCKWLDFDDMQTVMQIHNIPAISIDFRGTFAECIANVAQYKIANTNIPKLFNLPEREINVKEGVVLKPVKTRFMSSDGFYAEVGSRVMLKDKNDKKNFGTVESKQIKNLVSLEKLVPAEVMQLVEKIEPLIDVDRFQSVMSKMGVVPKNRQGKVMSDMVTDAMDELNRDGEESYQTYKAMSSENQKIVRQELIALAREIVLMNWQD